ncbi:hypothetical protein [Streptomyces iranensis]|uniref:Uncharacterized protein n=1 Tax=Streptomyces iranensis TaxID=576784 RepID=A0A060ZW23_9ACTN|nr:hypothetical protein [Streptomyces iranensis]MBP2062428.1 hypothetical protein [Streptomyces iranensis]CDR07364.1 predicted protein [Streptomyces iranensis]
MNDTLTSAVVESIAATGIRKARQGWTQHGQPIHALDIQDAAVFALKAHKARATVRAVEDVKRELASAWPESVPTDQAPAPTSATLSMEAALMCWRMSMYTLRRDASGWHLGGRPLQFEQLRKLASGWAVAVAEANGLGGDYAPDVRKVLADLRKLVRDAAPR